MQRLPSMFLVVLSFVLQLSAQSGAPPIAYRLTLPQPEQRTMQVEVTFAAIETQPLQLRMSRTSPGRYALHEFAKNVFDVRITDGAGRSLKPERPNPHQWDVAGHDGTVKVAYRVFGDRVDGTYLAVDDSHAHINTPSALMWARGLDERPVRITLEPPTDRDWRVATQLFPTDDPRVFTAPNLQYLMDSPIEFGAFTWRTFELPFAVGSTGDSRRATFRIALHHDGTEEEATQFAKDVERIVREERAIFDELAAFDGDTYTFLSDYLPWASGDGMEHRNSTVLTSSRSLREAREDLLGTVAHEFFHSWNVERIRPQSLEPFNFEEANMSGELWLAEGFTSYYDRLVLTRAGLAPLDGALSDWAGLVNAVTNSPGRQFRSAVQMSELAPFVDAARSVDPTNWQNTFISYYTYGAALGLALDLSLRELTDGRVTLDDYMQSMWATFGKPAGRAPGFVGRPYTIADARHQLAEASGSQAFAESFFAQYIEGTEAADYERLLALAGFVLRREHAGRAWLGLTPEERPEGLVIHEVARMGTPAQQAGLAKNDIVTAADAAALSTADGWQAWLESRKPGERVTLSITRAGQSLSKTVALGEDPRLEIVTTESQGLTLSPAQDAFRKAWLSTKTRDP